MSSATNISMITLKKRADFVRMNQSAVRFSAGGFVLQALATPDGMRAEGQVRLGFTVTKKVGGAVVRNRLKRRLRTVAASLIPTHGRAGLDYVLIGKDLGLHCPYELLTSDFAKALEYVHKRVKSP